MCGGQAHEYVNVIVIYDRIRLVVIVDISEELKIMSIGLSSE